MLTMTVISWPWYCALSLAHRERDLFSGIPARVGLTRAVLVCVPSPSAPAQCHGVSTVGQAGALSVAVIYGPGAKALHELCQMHPGVVWPGGPASWASCGGFKRAPTAAFALGLVTRSTHICLVLIIIDKMWLMVHRAGAGLLLPATLLSLESPRREPLLLYLICALSLQQGAARVQPACCFPC